MRWRGRLAVTVAAARKLVADLLPRDVPVFTASSEALRLSGVAEDVDESGELRSVRADAGDLRGDVDLHLESFR